MEISVCSGFKDTDGAFGGIRIGTLTDIHEPKRLEVLKSHTFLHVHMSLLQNLAPLRFHFLPVINFELVNQVARIDIKLDIPVGNDQHILDMFGDLPVCKR